MELTFRGGVNLAKFVQKKTGTTRSEAYCWQTGCVKMSICDLLTRNKVQSINTRPDSLETTAPYKFLLTYLLTYRLNCHLRRAPVRIWVSDQTEFDIDQIGASLAVGTVAPPCGHVMHRCSVLRLAKQSNFPLCPAFRLPTTRRQMLNELPAKTLDT